jgi:hypothetical protein
VKALLAEIREMVRAARQAVVHSVDLIQVRPTSKSAAASSSTINKEPSARNTEKRCSRNLPSG